MNKQSEIHPRSIEVKTSSDEKYILGAGKPKRDIPKSWKQYKVVLFPSLASTYNSGIVTLYIVHGNQNITLRYSMYREGCFHPICGNAFKINKNNLTWN